MTMIAGIGANALKKEHHLEIMLQILTKMVHPVTTIKMTQALITIIIALASATSRSCAKPR
jgi:hypothetical protein